MTVKCLVVCIFWRNTYVAYYCFNIKRVDQHGLGESVRFYGTTSCTRPRVAVAQSHPIASRPILYIKTHAYSNAMLCQNLKAISEELSEF
jgi:hypothetical protein